MYSDKDFLVNQNQKNIVKVNYQLFLTGRGNPAH